MERIIIRHLSGSKANQIEEFPFSLVRELTFGRDTSATVRYDPDRDDLVGRLHARISPDPSDPLQFVLTDLNSRNGTFVNKQKIVGATRINPGDLIQLGVGGPEFQFDIEPRPAGAVKATRLAASMAVAEPPPQTRVAAFAQPPAPGIASPPPFALADAPPPPRAAVGKATVERMITETVTETKKREGRKYLLAGGVALAALLVVIGAVAFVMTRRASHAEQQAQQARAGAQQAKTEAQEELDRLNANLAAKEAGAAVPPEQIVAANSPAVVKITFSWKLLSPTGGMVYHQYWPNDNLVPGGQRYVPLVVRMPSKKLEPFLIYQIPNQYSPAVGGAGVGSGFVVSEQGFILTNSHVAAGWASEYQFLDEKGAPAPYCYIYGEGKYVECSKVRWVPAKTEQDMAGGLFKGVNDLLEVSFPGQHAGIQAQLARVSDEHDVSLIKIELPSTAPRVALSENDEAVRPGGAVTALGYPVITPPVYGIRPSKNPFDPEDVAKEVVTPTVSAGHIGQVLRGDGQNTLSLAGDVYQLTINSTGPGNSGGPVFDDRGRVIAIFFAGRSAGGATVTYAVPISYGRRLMSVGGGAR